MHHPSFTLRTGREQSLGWTGGCQSPISQPVPQRLPQAPALQRRDSAWRRQHPQIQPNHRLLLPRLTGDQLPQGRVVPRVPRLSPHCAGEPCRSTSYFRHRILTGYSTSKLHPIIIHRCKHLGLPEQEDIGLDCSVISWKDSHAPGWSCRKHSAISAFRDGVSISGKSSSELSST